MLWVDRVVTEEQLASLNDRIALEGALLLRMRVKKLAPRLLQFILRKGKIPQIRRVCEGVELRVVDLSRVKVRHCDLGDLPEGCWRIASEEERDALREFGRGGGGQGGEAETRQFGGCGGGREIESGQGGGSRREDRMGLQDCPPPWRELSGSR